MPAIDFTEHPDLYSKAFSQLLHDRHASFQGRGSDVLVVKKEQLEALARDRLIPPEQIEQLIECGMLPSSLRNGSSGGTQD